MPFQSESQRKWMWAKHPRMASQWEKHTPDNVKLPKKVSS